MTFEIVVDQKNHTLDSRFSLAARSFSQAASVPGLGDFALLILDNSMY
ncbi:MAG: hypothetical protein KME54_27885 [Tolypothrix brevis GSE-NOS-MK-07-07A]|jgi:protein involved in ribonucleotide reduction|nr:hypothetical protein [Tolypothrix brevis GSE-NOS-MK-07-07A]